MNDDPPSPAKFRTELDAYSPPVIAQRVRELGVAKAMLSTPTLLTLGTVAGAFIGLGALFYGVVVTDTGLGFGVERLLGGLAFSLGLILVVIAGAELFTGNNLMVMAWASREISTAALLRNWGWVYIGNFAGALGLAALTLWSGLGDLNGSPSGEMTGKTVGETFIRIAVSKGELSWSEAFARGVLCNVLVCLAVWLAMSAHTVTGKILGMVPPIAAFVAIGFEHCVANMYLIPLGLVMSPADPELSEIVSALVQNLVPVTIGNIVGGSGLVAAVYWTIYLRK